MKILVTLAATALLSSAASAKTCEVTVESNDAMKFNMSEITINADCKDVKLTLKHVGKLPKSAMGHNWVLSKTADMSAITTAGIAAGLAKEYVPADAKVLASTKLIGGGETTSITFKKSVLKAGEDYSFFCTFPGHSAMMKGKVIVK